MRSLHANRGDRSAGHLEDVVLTLSTRLLRWTPRILGILLSLFLGLFALDAFGSGEPILEALPDFLIHLIPAVVLLLIVVISWRRPWIAGTAFVILAIVYTTTMARGRVDWMLVISAPLAIVGALFLWSWRMLPGR